MASGWFEAHDHVPSVESHARSLGEPGSPT